MSSAPMRHPFRPFEWPPFLAAMEASQRNLTLALAASLLLHGIVLSIKFHLPQALLRNTENALDVVLVNSKHAKKPKNAQVLAQANMDGGGNTDADVRLTTPLPPSKTDNDAKDLIEAKQRIAQLEVNARKLMTQLRSEKSVAGERGNNVPDPAKIIVNQSGMDLYSHSLAQIQQEGEIDRQQSIANKHPLRQVLAVRAKAVPEAMYVNAVLDKIEQIGTLNYPAEAKGKLSSKLMVTLVIWPDGSLKDIEIDRPTREKIFNEAARRIALMSAPFPKVPADVLGSGEVVSITRWWSFTRDDDLRTTDK